MGSIFMPFFAKEYGERLLGMVSITGIVDTWYIGIKTFYSMLIVQNGIRMGWDDRVNDEVFRK
jgi:hypothetical protein